MVSEEDSRSSGPWSRRSSFSLSPNAWSRRAEGLAQGDEPWWDLTVSNPTQVGFGHAPSLLDSLADPRSLQYEPEALGLQRQPIAELWGRRGYSVSPSQIAVTAGTSEAYGVLFKLLCDPGDSVLIPAPSYPLLHELSRFEGVELRPYPLTYDGAWSIDLDSLRRQRTATTRAVCVVNPNNPTGSYLKPAELEALLELGLPVISDEVFWDYPLQGPDAPRESVVAATSGLCFSLDGLSKTAALPQLKLGWITVAGDAGLTSEALGRLEVLLDAYLSVGTPVQLALAQLLREAEPVRRGIQGRTLANYEWLKERLRQTVVTPLFCEGGWYASLALPALMTDEAWAELVADEARVLTHPGYFFDFLEEARLVVSLLSPEALFQQGIERLLSVVERHAR
jgi:alanine-synthesizing transaminase